ncbi:hypothetical protein [Amycolatopsis vancoresmycina]|uniref:Uncharacterized protein n=1 Tax=Amycolatopsis vancoresmycina DSM 44592 TaxID=1292037 RepID=R1IJA5_9PSEU|nr:hypothetical protein [Amycolatopsis vancoresmycina]EOD70459.1 hypothetical protein H480_00847 [Amycolatopsis vancoresmycina DSM 44592]
MRKRKHPDRPEPEAVPAPRTSIAAVPAAVLRLQQAAGNRAVTGALPIQRFRSQNVPADEVAEQARHGGAEALSERNLAVVYVAEQGSAEAKAEKPVWSSGTQDPEQHAERIAVRQAVAGGARPEYHPQNPGAKRIVRVYTELSPCSSCHERLATELNSGVVVQSTAPPQNRDRWGAQVPNALWRTRVVLLNELYGLRAQATSPEAVAAFEEARSAIVSVKLTADEWERRCHSANEAAEAAKQVDAGWQAAVAHAGEVVRGAGRPAAQDVPVPVPQNVPVPVPPQDVPVPVRQGNLDAWLARANSPAVLTKKAAAPVFKDGGLASPIKKAKDGAACPICGKKVTINKTGKLRAHKNATGAQCRRL